MFLECWFSLPGAVHTLQKLCFHQSWAVKAERPGLLDSTALGGHHALASCDILSTSVPGSTATPEGSAAASVCPHPDTNSLKSTCFSSRAFQGHDHRKGRDLALDILQ